MIDTQTFVNALKDEEPKLFTSEDDARRVVKEVFAVIARALKNREVVSMEGIGELRTEPDNGRKRVVFAVDPKLLQGVNE
ncbi:MAG: HU family DNA-binding protein [Desulfohalobiaceae bacterium]